MNALRTTDSKGSLIQAAGAARRRWTAGRCAWVPLLKAPGDCLDYFFYDLEALTPAEWEVMREAKEGDIVVVQPTTAAGRGGDHAGGLHVYSTVHGFRTAVGEGTACLAAAGVGSSGLGTAAFARNLADAIGKPVAGVVSGLGTDDLFDEAWGGWVFFGGGNVLRNYMPICRWLPPPLQPLVAASAEVVERWIELFTRNSRDTQTLIALLSDASLRFPLLAGHSKGNLLMSEALHALPHERRKSLASDTQIVTFSARIWMPKPFREIVDVMGQFDVFGEVNSRPDLETDVIVPWARHTTNHRLPYSIDVEETMRKRVWPLLDHWRAKRSTEPTRFVARRALRLVQQR